MDKLTKVEASTPKDLISNPDVPDSPRPTEPNGSPDPPEIDPYPVVDPPIDPGVQPVDDPEPGPYTPDPIPGGPPEVIF